MSNQRVFTLLFERQLAAGSRRSLAADGTGCAPLLHPLLVLPVHESTPGSVRPCPRKQASLIVVTSESHSGNRRKGIFFPSSHGYSLRWVAWAPPRASVRNMHDICRSALILEIFFFMSYVLVCARCRVLPGERIITAWADYCFFTSLFLSSALRGSSS
ncbi:hypothetical protein BJV78DRAFT_1184360 [Lactifluus subvellereus]|nr:hypothetical protein BJV78DRAFT_1184360 [Lactifluus subvellereus]